MDIASMQCCGFREIGNLEDNDTTKEAMEGFCRSTSTRTWTPGGYKTIFRPTFSHVVFTEVISDGGYGRKFAAFIRKNRLGSVVASTVSTNPNSGNRVRGYIWTMDKRALSAWWAKHQGKA